MKHPIHLLMAVTLFWSSHIWAKTDLDYLPKGVSYDPEIPVPAEVLGSPVGEWHVRHDQLVQYMQLLAEKSDRVSIVETGRSHENRPLLLLTITAKQNHANIDSIQKKHVEAVTSGKKADPSNPLVIYMGYGVHGDEASGSNAALLVAYYLAAGQGEQVDALLNDNIVLLDPSLNPDGMARFAQWVNMHKSKTLVSDPNNREHVQGWPSGRTNHYWFDLNRDWLLLTHPESRGRIKQFHQWRPHVLTDFHEMGVNSSYFFQPGIPSRKNPWTPDKNVELTGALGDFHAAALDKEKELYFTQESFDDFYYGKGSTYPDAHGSIGILFEQASSRGHLQESINGPRTFADAIQNQFTTSLSTFAGSLANKQALLEYQTEFVTQTAELINDDELSGYLLTEKHDKSRFEALLALLKQHTIEIKGLSKSVKVGGKSFEPEHSVFVPLDQPQYRLIKSIFSERKRFNDNTFYDVSNWNLPLAFNIEYANVEKGLFRRTPLTDTLPSSAVTPEVLPQDAYAYAFSWSNYHAPKLLQSLLSKGVEVRVAGKAFVAKTPRGDISFSAGSVVIPMALSQPDDLQRLLADASSKLNVKVWPITSGLTGQGIDLGSRHMRVVKQPKVLLVGGSGTSQYEVGEAWHYLDKHVGMPVSIIEIDRLGRIDWSQYTHAIWVNGNYSSVSDATAKNIERWVRQGGVLIGQKQGAKWFSDKEWLKASLLKREDIDNAFSTDKLRFADREALDAKKRIAGAVFQADIDMSHPLAFGYQDDQLPLFRNSNMVMELPAKPFVTVAQYTKLPLMAGYTSDEMQELIADSAAIVAHRMGRGRVIGFTTNLNFRGYWYGTSRLMSNAIFMSGFINVGG